MPRQPRPAAEHRSRILARWAASGLSATAFSERCGVATWTLYRWRREARSEPGEETTSGSSPTFAEIVLRPSRENGGSAREHAAGAPPIEIVVGETRVRVGRGFDDDHLRRVLDVVRRAG